MRIPLEPYGIFLYPDIISGWSYATFDNLSESVNYGSLSDDVLDDESLGMNISDVLLIDDL
jgi:hypothetical protein